MKRNSIITKPKKSDSTVKKIIGQNGKRIQQKQGYYWPLGD